MVRGRDLLLALLAHRQPHLHVRLARADPYLADEDVVQLDLVLAADGHVVGLAIGLHGRQHHLPIALGVGLGRGRRLVELDRDLFAGIGPAPDGQRPVALQHHVAAKHLGQLDVGLGLGHADDTTSRETTTRHCDTRFFMADLSGWQDGVRGRDSSQVGFPVLGRGRPRDGRSARRLYSGLRPARRQPVPTLHGRSRITS